MKKHTKIYMKFFDYGETDCIPCEYCGSVAVDIHHLEGRGMGGSKTKDTIENLIALCRKHHIEAENKKEFNNLLKEAHKKTIENWRSYRSVMSLKKEEVSNCCSELVDENTDICSRCGEHCKKILI